MNFKYNFYLVLLLYFYLYIMYVNSNAMFVVLQNKVWFDLALFSLFNNFSIILIILYIFEGTANFCFQTPYLCHDSFHTAKVATTP